MDMPIIKPLLIPTQKKPLISRIVTWVFEIRKWEVVNDWTFKLRDGTTIVIPSGFVFDGASIPRPLWAVLSPVGLLFIPGLIHDYAYKYNKLLAIDSEGNITDYKKGAGKAYWDRVFRQTGKDVNGMPIIDALAWFALFFGGWYPWWQHRNSEKLQQPEIEEFS